MKEYFERCSDAQSCWRNTTTHYPEEWPFLASSAQDEPELCPSDEFWSGMPNISPRIVGSHFVGLSSGLPKFILPKQDPSCAQAEKLLSWANMGYAQAKPELPRQCPSKLLAG